MEDLFHLGIKGVIRNSKSEILLLKVNPANLKKYNGDPYWELPGGRIQRHEDVIKTLKREIFEETGINEIFDIKVLGMVLTQIRIPIETVDVGLILSLYECKIHNDIEIKLSSEHLEYSWFSKEDAKNHVKVKYPIELINYIN